MKKLVAKKSIKTTILIISVALLLIAGTLGWFAKVAQSKVDGITASIGADKIEFYEINTENSTVPVSADNVVISPGSTEHKYMVVLSNATESSYDVFLRLSTSDVTGNEDLREYIEFSKKDSDSDEWEEWSAVGSDTSQYTLLSNCSDKSRSLYFKFRFPGSDNEVHNKISNQSMGMEIILKHSEDFELYQCEISDDDSAVKTKISNIDSFSIPVNDIGEYEYLLKVYNDDENNYDALLSLSGSDGDTLKDNLKVYKREKKSEAWSEVNISDGSYALKEACEEKDQEIYFKFEFNDGKTAGDFSGQSLGLQIDINKN